ncbi:uncharacterized protein LOC135210114 [Macrobrachium nipponense]|uniref:uncharacterized protein LOC135210114 n=1 Tax=Macrobrachium nipponense TaxID=159736 RepID=UPI0030C88BFD
MNKERFRHETDYLEMLASPDIRHITRDEVSQSEDGEHGTGKTNHDLQMHTESTTSDPDQGTGYLPMSSGTRSPRSFFDIFSPKRTSENFMFTFEEEAQSKNSNTGRQSCPHRGIPLHQDKLPSTKSLGRYFILSPNSSLRHKTVYVHSPQH